MSDTEVLDLTSICRCFPESPCPEVHREHLLDTIDKIFEDSHVVVVEGEEGIGRTTLLAQFAKRYPETAISLFMRPTSRLAYAQEYLRQILCEQIHWINKGEIIDCFSSDEAFLRTELSLLQRLSQKRRTNYYFIIDGLNDIPNEDSRLQDAILKDMLPLGLKGFRFLLSGDLTQISKSLHRSLQSKSFPLPKFSLDDTEKYLRDLNLSRQSSEEVYRMCHKVPGNLASVRRMLLSGYTLQSILDEDPERLPDFLAIEWRKMLPITGDLKTLLAIIAYARKSYTVGDLAAITLCDLNRIVDMLEGLRIVSVNSDNKEVQFVSEAHRRYAAKQLHDLKEKATDLLIDHLLKDTNSEMALSYLPAYYEQAGKLNDLISCLTPDHFTKLIEQSHSLSPLQQRAELGIRTAWKISHNEALVRFSMQKSMLNKLRNTDIWRSEIEARMSLNEYDSALVLTQSAVLKEDRLRLLAIVAKIKHEQGIPVEQELTEQICLLYEQLDQKALGEVAFEIAADLICINPDLAIKIVESSSTVGDDESAVDWAFAKLSIAALSEGKSKPHHSIDAVEKVRSRIKNPKAHQLTDGACVLFGNYSASDVLTYVNKLDDRNRLFFLRQWILVNQDREDASDVVEYALNLIIKTTSQTTPKMEDLREIACALPSIPDRSKIRHLVGRFDSQKTSVENFGTNEDYVRLQLLLAEAESKYDFKAAHNRMMETYWHVNELQDLSTKTECMSWIVASLQNIDPNGDLEILEGLHSVTQEELKGFIENLLSYTAEHFRVACGSIRALSKAKPQMALLLAQSLNTGIRRNKALLDLVETLSKNCRSQVNIKIILEILDHIDHPTYFSESVLAALKPLSSLTGDQESDFISDAIHLISKVSSILDASDRCEAYSYAYSFLKKCDSREIYSRLTSSIENKLNESWKAIDIGWHRIDIGFKIARILAATSPEIAKSYVEASDKLKEDIIIDSDELALVFLTCLRLSIRAFSGLLFKGLNSAEDMQRLTSLINRIPSNGERVGLWAELAVRCYLAKRNELCDKVVTNHIRPLIQNINEADTEYRYSVIAYAAPALYFAHRATAIDQIKKLPTIFLNRACRNICNTILRKVPLSDPYEGSYGEGYIISYEDIIDICDLLEIVSYDELIYDEIVEISNSLAFRKNRDRIALQQRMEIGNRLEDIVSRKLPDLDNIKHEGYKIVSLAEIARVRKADQKTWNCLVSSARNIPNLADKGLIFAMIGRVMPQKHKDMRDQLFDEAEENIAQIPADVDRIDRYHILAEVLSGVDPAKCRKVLRTGIEQASSTVNPEAVFESQRRMIDLAHKLDPSFASSLISLIDDDPARAQNKKKLNRQLHLLESAKKMAAPAYEEFNHNRKADASRAAWINLGRMNANRIDTIEFGIIRNYLQLASEFPIGDAYPILSWIIENVVRRHSKTESAANFILPVFEATILSAELAGRIAARSLLHLKRIKGYTAKPVPDGGDSSIIRTGERDVALAFLSKWFSNEINEYLKISDPYFGLDDLELLLLVRAERPDCRVSILTSRKHQQETRVVQPWEEAFRNHWRLKLSDQDPPETEVVIVGTESRGDSPIHDRWWLTKGGGVRVGTSFNSLGISKIAEISILSPMEAELREMEVDQYLQREMREHNGERLRYTLFTL